jgi:hypothetical protein
MPMLPLEATLKNCALDDEETVKRLIVSPAVPVILSFDVGVDDPIPTLPVERIEKSVEPVDEATVKRFCVDVPCMKSDACPVDVPMLTLLVDAFTVKSGLDEVPTVKEP